MRYMSNKWLYILLMVASVSLVGCQQEDVNSNGGTEKRDPNLVSVSFDMSAAVQDSIPSNEPPSEARALSYTLEDGQKDGKTSYSVLKFNADTAPETLEAYGIFYCPTAPEGKEKVYVSNGPMQWKKRTTKDNKVRYEIHKGGIVDVDRTLMDGTHQWYFAAVVGAEYDAATKTFSFDPYKDAKASGLTYQLNGEPIDLNLPMTTSWSKLKVREPEEGSTEHWFYPQEYVITQGLPEGVAPSIVFRPRGTVFRMLMKNESSNDVRIMSYNLESNALAFKTTISSEDILGLSNIAQGDKLKMTPVMNHPAEVLVFDRDGSEGRIVRARHESQSGAALAWGFLNEAKQKELAPSIGKKVSDTEARPEVPYLLVRATAEPSGDDKWNSMEKAADYFPIENRVSYISQAPIFYTYVRDLSHHYQDGGSEWLRVKLSRALTNLERTSFEVISNTFRPGKPGAFKRGHPWMNRHADNKFYFLDGVAYPRLDQLKYWLSSQSFIGESDEDPDLVDHKGNILTNLKSTAKYYLPHAEEIQSYIPIPVNAGKMDSVYLEAGKKTEPFDVDVMEQDLNLKHGVSVGSIATARFILKGGNSDEVNTLNYGKDLKTGRPIPMVENIGWDAKQMAPYNYFNYFWCSHIVYGLAYLRKGDPESLVAYRYFWGISPEDVGVPLGNNKYKYLGHWSAGSFAKLSAIYGPENATILRKGFSDPNCGETIRRLSAFSAGRLVTRGAGAAMVSFFSVAMRHIGRQDPLVRSLSDIDVVSKEQWWTANPQNVIFRIFTAVGFFPPKGFNGTSESFLYNRNRGVYILTQTNDDGAGNHDYFYIGPRSWGRFNTKDEPELSKMWLKMHENEGRNYNPGGQTPKYGTNTYLFDGAPEQYYISGAFMPALSGAPTHFMVGTDPKK